MSTEELDCWQSILDRWKAEAEELISSKEKPPIHGVKYAMGNNLIALVNRNQKEIDHFRKIAK